MFPDRSLQQQRNDNSMNMTVVVSNFVYYDIPNQTSHYYQNLILQYSPTF